MSYDSTNSLTDHDITDIQHGEFGALLLTVVTAGGRIRGMMGHTLEDEYGGPLGLTWQLAECFV